MKKIGITGGSGFIGQQITSLLLDKNIKLNLVIYLNQIRFFLMIKILNLKNQLI